MNWKAPPRRWHLPGFKPREALCGVILLPTASLLPPELVARLEHPDFDLSVCPLCLELLPSQAGLSPK